MSTPIAEGRNLGLTSGARLREVGIATVEELHAVGWQNAAERLATSGYANLNMIYALIGATTDRDWRDLEPEEKARARSFLAQLN